MVGQRSLRPCGIWLRMCKGCKFGERELPPAAAYLGTSWPCGTWNRPVGGAWTLHLGFYRKGGYLCVSSARFDI